MTYLNILWHFHQPFYMTPESNRIDSATITFRVLYNYYPMALMIKNSGMKLSCNFTPPLIIQIKKIAKNQIIDGFQALLQNENSLDLEKIAIFLEDLPAKIKVRYTIFKKLIDKFYSKDISGSEISDLKMWMHLACIHPYVLKYFPEIDQLCEKSVGFTSKDRQVLIDFERNVFSQVISLYRELLESGSIEISTTPGYHPIMPLVYDLSIARKTSTSLEIPSIEFSYPEDVRAHIEMGIGIATDVFGKRISGIWPAEGSISNEVLDILMEYGIKWLGADEQILYGSNCEQKDISSTLYKWKNTFNIFFRNHHFSDRIGFIYHSWEESAAADDLVKRIHEFSSGREKILTIILDGENPWEWYRQDGSVFLTSFYQKVVSDNSIKPITFSQACELNFKTVSLHSIPAGSWMGLNFDNWIGKPDANKLWSILADARKTAKQHASRQEIQQELKNLFLMAESSDFFWWMSVPAEQSTKVKFYSLFRSIISKIYKTSGLVVPVEVAKAFVPATKINQPENYITANIDGKITNFFEWSGASEIDITQLWMTFQPFDLPVKKLFYGYDRDNLYIRIDISRNIFTSISIETEDRGIIFSYDITKETFTDENIAVDECMEIKIPWEKIGKDLVHLLIRMKSSDTEIMIPPAGYIVFEKKSFDDEWNA
ncbi:MAG: glycoside hydrolase family 57 protein [Candidatus Ratteibacteria bacterium]